MEVRTPTPVPRASSSIVQYHAGAHVRVLEGCAGREATFRNDT